MGCRRFVISSSGTSCMALILSQCGECQSVGQQSSPGGQQFGGFRFRRGGFFQGQFFRRSSQHIRFQQRNENDHFQKCFDTAFPFMPLQASYQLQALWIGLIAEAVADLCLFASLLRSHENFQTAFYFCLNAVSYLKLMSVLEQESSIIDANVILDILKENRHDYGKGNCSRRVQIWKQKGTSRGSKRIQRGKNRDPSC